MKPMSCFTTLATLALMTACRSPSKESRQEPLRAIDTVGVERTEVSRSLPLSGALFLASETKLAFKVGGIIHRIHVREGQFVRKDQVLADLYATDIRAMTNQARSALDKSARDKARAESLFRDGVATLEQLQNAETAYRVAQENVTLGEFNLYHASIRAPFTGRVLKKFAEDRESVGPGQPIVLMGGKERRWLFKAGATGSECQRLLPGDSATVWLSEARDRRLSARVSEIGASADPMTGALTVELALDPAQGALYSGAIGRAQVFPSRKAEFALIPVAALMRAEGSRGEVMTYDGAGGKVRTIPVRIAFLQGSKVAVEEGLEGVANVVVLGQAFVRDPSRVKVAPIPVAALAADRAR